MSVCQGDVLKETNGELKQVVRGNLLISAIHLWMSASQSYIIQAQLPSIDSSNLSFMSVYAATLLLVMLHSESE